MSTAKWHRQRRRDSAVVEPQEPPSNPAEVLEQARRRVRPAAPQGHGWPAERWCSSATDPRSSTTPAASHQRSSSAAAPHRSTSAEPAAPWHSVRSSISSLSATARCRRVASLATSASCEQPSGPSTSIARTRANATSPSTAGIMSPTTGEATPTGSSATLTANAQIRLRAGALVQRPPLIGERTGYACAGTVRLRWRRRARGCPHPMPAKRCQSPQRWSRRRRSRLPRTSRGESTVARPISFSPVASAVRAVAAFVERLGECQQREYRACATEDPRQETGRCRAAVPAPRAHLCNALPRPPHPPPASGRPGDPE